MSGGQRFFRSGEAAGRAGVSADTLRHYERLIAWYLSLDTDVLQAEAHAAASRVALRMSAYGVVSQVCDDAVQNQFEPVEPVEHRAEEIVQDVRPAHGDDASGDGDSLSRPLTRVGERSLQRRGAQARPDETFHQGRLGAGEGVQVGVGLPLLEHQLDLPAQAVHLGDLARRQHAAW